MLYHHVFGTSAVKNVQLEHARPLVIPAGSDSFAGIGKPPLVEGVLSDQPGDKWRAACETKFPAKESKTQTADLALVESEQFAEEVVDELRRQKRDELLKLRQEMELDEKTKALQK